MVSLSRNFGIWAKKKYPNLDFLEEIFKSLRSQNSKVDAEVEKTNEMFFCLFHQNENLVTAPLPHISSGTNRNGGPAHRRTPALAHFYARGREDMVSHYTHVHSHSLLCTLSTYLKVRVKQRGSRCRPWALNSLHANRRRASFKLWFPLRLKGYYPIATNPIAFSGKAHFTKERWEGVICLRGHRLSLMTYFHIRPGTG